MSTQQQAAAPHGGTLQQWLDWQLQLHPQSIELGLKRISQVFQRLALDTDTPRILSIAGTNGKGSCAHAAEQLVLAAGETVGCYTSPHLWAYNERIRINGAPASDGQICAAFEAIEACRGDISLSFFEYGTLAALYLFAQEKLQTWVLEVGLGGRLDAVNVVDADVAVVTSIGLDHEAWLGRDIAVIGQEKAAIARAGKPLLMGPGLPDSVADTAQQLAAKPLRWSQARVEQALPEFSCSQALVRSNLQLAALACQALGLDLKPDTISQTLGQLKLPGRCQRIERDGRDEVFDVAHNPDAMRVLAEYLAGLPPKSSVYAVFSALNDKDVAELVKPLIPLIDSWCIAELENERAMNEAGLLKALSAAKKVRKFATIPQALDYARAHAQRVVVCGSFFTVAAAGQNTHG